MSTDGWGIKPLQGGLCYLTLDELTQVLVTTASKIDGKEFSLSGDDLELLLGEVHRLTLAASTYSDRYHATLAADDSRRSEIRAEHVALAAACMQIPLKKKLGE